MMLPAMWEKSIKSHRNQYEILVQNMNFVTPKIAPPGLLDDAASDMGRKVSDYIGINMRYFSEQEFRYQKNGASGVIG